MEQPILYLRTDRDGRDLLSVLEIYYYDEDGEEAIHAEATNACMGLDTCEDAGHLFLLDNVERKLKAENIDFSQLDTEETYSAKL